MIVLLWLEVECYDFDDDGDHDMIGSFSTTVEELMKAAKSSVNFLEIYFVFYHTTLYVRTVFAVAQCPSIC